MDLLTSYKSTRAHTKALCLPLEIEDYVVQPAVFASPPKWHLGHTTWFFETFILKQHLENYQLFDEDFGFLFNSYYNHEGERLLRAHRGNMTRPNVKEVFAYRAHVDAYMEQFLSENTNSELEALVVLGIQHEQQHQELLLTDIKYTLGHNPLFPIYQDGTPLVHKHNKTHGFVSVNEGVYEIGYKGKDFCYDNELGVHKVYIHDFEINKALVTNVEYIAFIEDGGYSKFDLWLDAGWSWVQENTIEAPLYWFKKEETWYHYTLAGLQKIDPEAILSHVSFYEAAAFAEWKQMRLPTEFEWEIASQHYEWGERWEWTHSAYLPYPNFKKAEGAIGEYNGKFMINQMVLRGASVATAQNHSRSTYRNFFHPQERWQFTGIRLVK